MHFSFKIRPLNDAFSLIISLKAKGILISIERKKRGEIAPRLFQPSEIIKGVSFLSLYNTYTLLILLGVY